MILTLLISTSIQWTWAERLSNKALFYRCYGQLTQTRPDRNGNLLKQVMSGVKTPIQACIDVLNGAELANGKNAILVNDSDDARKILRTFHGLHASWFQSKEFPENFTFVQNRSIQSIYDNSSPALYLTRSLFSSQIGIDDILTSTENITPRRQENNPNQFTNLKKEDFAFDQSQFQFASMGDLLGTSVTDSRLWSYTFTNNNNGRTTKGSIAIGQHYGGGILGNPTYLTLTIDEDTTFKADGAVEMPRKWARNLISDLMCRELPLIRPNDADSLVVPESNVEFRKAKACNRCHATMDRMASTIRNMTFRSVGGQNIFTPRYGGAFPETFVTNKSAEAGWPAVLDPDYAHRPTNGRLFYRNYKGNLIDLPLSNVGDFGRKLSQQDDVYICIASRYYEYFTGIKTNIGDIDDISLGYQLTEADLEHRNLVIGLGKDLKIHKNSKTLIEKILNLPIYRESDLGVSSSRGLASE